MQREAYGWEFDVRSRFPHAREVRRSGYVSVYAAERDGKYYLIDDHSLTADFICPLQPGAGDSAWVEVLTFENRAERQTYLEEHWPADQLSISIDSR